MKIQKLVLASSFLAAVGLITAASNASSILGDWYGTYTIVGYTQTGTDPSQVVGVTDSSQLTILASHGSSFGGEYVGTWSRKNGMVTVDYSKSLTDLIRADSGDPHAYFKLKLKNVTATKAHGLAANMVEKQRVKSGGVVSKLKANGVYSADPM